MKQKKKQNKYKVEELIQNILVITINVSRVSIASQKVFFQIRINNKISLYIYFLPNTTLNILDI